MEPIVQYHRVGISADLTATVDGVKNMPVDSCRNQKACRRKIILSDDVGNEREVPRVGTACEVLQGEAYETAGRKKQNELMYSRTNPAKCVSKWFDAYQQAKSNKREQEREIAIQEYENIAAAQPQQPQWERVRLGTRLSGYDASGRKRVVESCVDNRDLKNCHRQVVIRNTETGEEKEVPRIGKACEVLDGKAFETIGRKRQADMVRVRDADPSADPSVMELCATKWKEAMKIARRVNASNVKQEAILIYSSYGLPIPHHVVSAVLGDEYGFVVPVVPEPEMVVVPEPEMIVVSEVPEVHEVPEPVAVPAQKPAPPPRIRKPASPVMLLPPPSAPSTPIIASFMQPLERPLLTPIEKDVLVNALEQRAAEATEYAQDISYLQQFFHNLMPSTPGGAEELFGQTPRGELMPSTPGAAEELFGPLAEIMPSTPGGAEELFGQIRGDWTPSEDLIASVDAMAKELNMNASNANQAVQALKNAPEISMDDPNVRGAIEVVVHAAEAAVAEEKEEEVEQNVIAEALQQAPAIDIKPDMIQPLVEIAGRHYRYYKNNGFELPFEYDNLKIFDHVTESSPTCQIDEYLTTFKQFLQIDPTVYETGIGIFNVMLYFELLASYILNTATVTRDDIFPPMWIDLKPAKETYNCFMGAAGSSPYAILFSPQKQASHLQYLSQIAATVSAKQVITDKEALVSFVELCAPESEADLMRAFTQLLLRTYLAEKETNKNVSIPWLDDIAKLVVFPPGESALKVLDDFLKTTDIRASQLAYESCYQSSPQCVSYLKKVQNAFDTIKKQDNFEDVTEMIQELKKEASYMLNYVLQATKNIVPPFLLSDSVEYLEISDEPAVEKCDTKKIFKLANEIIDRSPVSFSAVENIITAFKNYSLRVMFMYNTLAAYAAVRTPEQNSRTLDNMIEQYKPQQSAEVYYQTFDKISNDTNELVLGLDKKGLQAFSFLASEVSNTVKEQVFKEKLIAVLYPYIDFQASKPDLMIEGAYQLLLIVFIKIIMDNNGNQITSRDKDFVKKTISVRNPVLLPPKQVENIQDDFKITFDRDVLKPALIDIKTRIELAESERHARRLRILNDVYTMYKPSIWTLEASFAQKRIDTIQKQFSDAQEAEMKAVNKAIASAKIVAKLTEEGTASEQSNRDAHNTFEIDLTNAQSQIVISRGRFTLLLKAVGEQTASNIENASSLTDNDYELAAEITLLLQQNKEKINAIIQAEREHQQKLLESDNVLQSLAGVSLNLVDVYADVPDLVEDSPPAIEIEAALKQQKLEEIRESIMAKKEMQLATLVVQKFKSLKQKNAAKLAETIERQRREQLGEEQMAEQIKDLLEEQARAERVANMITKAMAKAATKIQKRYREHATEKTNEELQRNIAAARIQKTYKKRLEKIASDKLKQAEQEAALTIQSQARRVAAVQKVKTLREAKEKLRNEMRELDMLLKAEQEAVAARIRAEEESRKLAEENARIKEVENARIRAEEEAQLRAEQEARDLAAEQARMLAEEEAKLRAEQEARILAEQEERIRFEKEAKLRAEEEARILAEKEAREQEEARARAEEEARILAEKEAREQEEARIRAVQEAAEEAARVLAQEEASRVLAEEEAARVLAAEEARQKAEAALLAEQKAQRAEQEALIAMGEEEALTRAEIAQMKAEKAKQEARQAFANWTQTVPAEILATAQTFATQELRKLQQSDVEPVSEDVDELRMEQLLQAYVKDLLEAAEREKLLMKKRPRRARGAQKPAKILVTNPDGTTAVVEISGTEAKVQETLESSKVDIWGLILKNILSDAIQNNQQLPDVLKPLLKAFNIDKKASKEKLESNVQSTLEALRSLTKRDFEEYVNTVGEIAYRKYVPEVIRFINRGDAKVLYYEWYDLNQNFLRAYTALRNDFITMVKRKLQNLLSNTSFPETSEIINPEEAQALLLSLFKDNEKLAGTAFLYGFFKTVAAVFNEYHENETPEGILVPILENFGDVTTSIELLNAVRPNFEAQDYYNSTDELTKNAISRALFDLSRQTTSIPSNALYLNIDPCF